MRFSTMKSATLLALAVCSTLALAQAQEDRDPPARVGRVSMTQGQVNISSAGEAANAALVNWPVTSNQTISTLPGARTELRVGSTAIRLDGDSALEVVQLDDEKLRLRLHYGSASIRVLNEEVAAGFELTTPQARVLLQQPGRLRVDAERVRDGSSIRVFDGVAVVEGAGERLTVRSGRSAEVIGLDLRMSQAANDAFDDWAAMRDRETEAVRATRFVPAEMTGYEDLDRYGSWRDDSEFGSVWLPAVSSTWVPYRDGRWTWIAPWGWTWVDNAPWGYAPFHYGRWVQINNRWGWAPGRLERHPVWAPALVGWVGGAGWNLNFNSRPSAGQGWYPLAPHERFVPGYRLSDDHLRRLAWQAARGRDARPDGKHDGKKRDYRREGLTVVPQDRFSGRREVVVPREPRATPPANWARAPVALPPTPPVKFGSIGQGANVRDAARAVAEDAARAAGRNDGRGDGRGNERRDWNRDGRPDARPDGRPDYAGRGSQPAAVPASPAVPAAPAASPLPAAPQAAVIGSSVPVIVGGGRERDRDDRVYQDLRARSEDGRRNRYQQRTENEAQVPRSAVPVLSGQPAPVMSAQPAPQRNWSRDVQRDAQRDAQREVQREAQRDAARDVHRESPRFGSAGAMEAAAAAAAARAQQQARPVPAAISAPPPRAMPSPPPAPAPAIAAPAPSPAPSAAPERRHAPAAQPRNADDGGGRRGPARQMER